MLDTIIRPHHYGDGCTITLATLPEAKINGTEKRSKVYWDANCRLLLLPHAGL